MQNSYTVKKKKEDTTPVLLCLSVHEIESQTAKCSTKILHLKAQFEKKK